MIFKIAGILIFILIIAKFFMGRRERNRTHLEAVGALKSMMSYLISEYGYSMNTMDTIFRNLHKMMKKDHPLEESIKRVWERLERAKESIDLIWDEEVSEIIWICKLEGVIEQRIRGLAGIFGYLDKQVQIKAFRELERELIDWLEELNLKYQNEKSLLVKLQVVASLLVVILCF